MAASIFHPDILSLIFISAYDESPSPSTTTTLRSVSSAWMSLAASVHQLWTKVILNKSSHFTSVERTLQYIQNSGTLLLDVELTLADISLLGTKEAVEIIALLRENVARFRTLNIHAAAHEGIEALMTIGTDIAAPKLEELDLIVEVCTEVDDINDFISISNAFTPSPRLQRLHMAAWPLPIGVPPHFRGLTSLSFDGTFFDTVDTLKLLDLIRATQALEYFKFKAADDFSYTTTSRLDFPDIIFLPHLKKVDVTAPGAGTDLLRTFDAPLLAEMRLDGWRPGHYPARWESSLTEPLSVTIQRISQRSPNLRKLELEYLKLHAPTSEHRAILSGEAFPNLEELVITTTDVDDDALFGASGKVSSLKKVELIKCKGITGPALISFVGGRTSEFSLIVKDCRGVDAQYLNAISKFA